MRLCRNGHEMTEENTLRSSQQIRCRTCVCEYQRWYRATHRTAPKQISRVRSGSDAWRSLGDVDRLYDTTENVCARCGLTLPHDVCVAANAAEHMEMMIGGSRADAHAIAPMRR